jgi:hypothetical protein
MSFLLLSCGKSNNTTQGVIKKPWEHGALMVSTNQRMLQHTDSTGFFWMADTAWQMSYKLNKEEVKQYLTNRKDKGFSVIQMSAVMKGNFPENRDGAKPFNQDSIVNPNQQYWENIDFIIETAEEKGLYIALLPAWFGVLGSNVNDANTYASFIAKRYKNKKNIIWVLGGDSGTCLYANPVNKWETNINIWNNVGKTIDEIVGNNQLMTFHPCGLSGSSDWFKEASWIDFHMIQSGHGLDEKGANALFQKHYKDTHKPIFDGEPRYETILRYFSEQEGRYTSKDVRRIAYMQVFSGAFGHTYGHHSIWQFWTDGPVDCCGSTEEDKTWSNALNDKGAEQMGYLAKLMKSRPILKRVPDNTMIMKGTAIATKGEGYAFVYLPNGGEVSIDFTKVFEKKVKAWWYNTRTGESRLDNVYNSSSHIFTTGDKDMVLVLDDVRKNYPAPGAGYIQPKDQ